MNSDTTALSSRNVSGYPYAVDAPALSDSAQVSRVLRNTYALLAMTCFLALPWQAHQLLTNGVRPA